MRLTRRAEEARVDAIVVACLDLSATIAHVRTTIPIIDASGSLAEELVAEWLRLTAGQRSARGAPRSR